MKDLYLAKYCKYSYDYQTHSSGGVEFIWDKPKSLIVIRGTEFETCQGKLDVIRDLLLIPYKSFGLWGHLGFMKGGLRTLKIVLPLLDKEVPITITGHSLGGAVAQALSFFLVLSGYQVKSLVTFGSPTVFYRKIPKDLLDKINNITLYENHSDFVTRLPIGEHVVKKLKINRTKKLFSFSGHKINNYILNLKG